MDPKPTLVQIQPKDQQFNLLLAAEKVGLGVALIVGMKLLIKRIPGLDQSIDPIIQLIVSGVLSHAVVDIFGKNQFDNLIKASAIPDDTKTDSTN